MPSSDSVIATSLVSSVMSDSSPAEDTSLTGAGDGVDTAVDPDADALEVTAVLALWDLAADEVSTLAGDGAAEEAAPRSMLPVEDVLVVSAAREVAVDDDSAGFRISELADVDDAVVEVLVRLVVPGSREARRAADPAELVSLDAVGAAAAALPAAVASFSCCFLFSRSAAAVHHKIIN
jgi:hypothetical protein